MIFSDKQLEAVLEEINQKIPKAGLKLVKIKTLLEGREEK